MHEVTGYWQRGNGRSVFKLNHPDHTIVANNHVIPDTAPFVVSIKAKMGNTEQPAHTLKTFIGTVHQTKKN